MMIGDKVINWDEIEKKQRELIHTLHNNLGWFNDEELLNTPKRITKFYKEWMDNREVAFTKFEAPGEDYQSLIILKDIRLYSMCSHHMLPFFSHAHVCYYPRPGGKICGISKLARSVRKFASRPQTQEKLSKELVNYLYDQLEPEFCMVVVEAEHLCMKMRGVREPETVMITNSLRWNKESDFAVQYFEQWKEEFLNFIHK